jgi:hypothetical protein
MQRSLTYIAWALSLAGALMATYLLLFTFTNRSESTNYAELQVFWIMDVVFFLGAITAIKLKNQE